jgi:hypothetical protein
VEAFTDFDAFLAARPDVTVVSLAIPPQPRFDYAARNLPAECLMKATDQVNEHTEWSGLRCDDSNQNVNNFDFLLVSAATDKSPAISNIAGQMNTTTKANKFVAFYTDSGSKHTLQAVCGQKK